MTPQRRKQAIFYRSQTDFGCRQHDGLSTLLTVSWARLTTFPTTLRPGHLLAVMFTWRIQGHLGRLGVKAGNSFFGSDPVINLAPSPHMTNLSISAGPRHRQAQLPIARDHFTSTTRQPRHFFQTSTFNIAVFFGGPAQAHAPPRWYLHPIDETWDVINFEESAPGIQNF